VFADLGHPNPEEVLAKSQLVWEISKVIKRRRLTQAKVARIYHENFFFHRQFQDFLAGTAR
jgi:hypothetical protein